MNSSCSLISEPPFAPKLGPPVTRHLQPSPPMLAHGSAAGGGAGGAVGCGGGLGAAVAGTARRTRRRCWRGGRRRWGWAGRRGGRYCRGSRGDRRCSDYRGGCRRRRWGDRGWRRGAELQRDRGDLDRREGRSPACASAWGSAAGFSPAHALSVNATSIRLVVASATSAGHLRGFLRIGFCINRSFPGVMPPSRTRLRPAGPRPSCACGDLRQPRRLQRRPS